MRRLSKRRPVFHSEADFQHELAWEIKLVSEGTDVRLERRLPWEGPRNSVDIWLETIGGPAVIELKYWTRALEVTVSGEQFSLRDQAAHDLARHDFLKDLRRVEQVVASGLADTGWVVALSNDHLYWKMSRPNTIDRAFLLYEGRRAEGMLAWSGRASAGTRKGREDGIRLSGAYEMRWSRFSRAGDEPASDFRYLLTEVQGTRPAPTNATALRG